jgi:DNA-binding PadR family transcriptional regulator
MAPTRLRRNLLAYLVLNLLAEAPMHPYQIKRLIHSRGKDLIVDVNPASLYHAIAQLERAAVIEPVETIRDGRRPERTVYRATEAGVAELLAWMIELLTQAPAPRAIAALAHLAVMEPAEVRVHLERRAEALATQIAGADALVASVRDQVPRVFLVEGEYARALRQAELDWVRSIVDDLASGRLTWDRAELMRISEADRRAAEDGPVS